MKIGERWKLVNPGACVLSDAVRGDVVEITELFREEHSDTDWVVYLIVEDSIDGVGMQGCLRRERFLIDYEKMYENASG